MQALQPKRTEHGGLYTWGLNKKNACGTEGKKTAATAKTKSKESEEIVPVCIYSQKPKGDMKEQLVQVSTGGFFGAAVSEQGSLLVWGCAQKGRCGVPLAQLTEKTVSLTKVHVTLNGKSVKILQVACGNWHSVVLSADGLLFTTGHNGYGQLGLDDNQDRAEFQLVQAKNSQQSAFAKPIVSIAAGDGTTCAIDQDGTLHSCGHYSRNGFGGTKHVYVFAELLKNITHISCGFTHSAATDLQGRLYTWGIGTFYQLGHGNNSDQPKPMLVEALRTVQIVQSSCTRGEKYGHTGAVDVDGRVYTWGCGYKGKLGHYKEWTHEDPADEPLPKLIQAISDIRIKKISCGGIHTTLLAGDGRVFSFGCGSNGRIGHPEYANYTYLYREGLPRLIETLPDRVIDISASYYHNACIVAP